MLPIHCFFLGRLDLVFIFYLEEEYNSISDGYLDFDTTNTRDIMQEIAMNVIWSEEEYNSMTDGYLDYDTTMTKQTVCKVSLTIEMW
jgi:hypothetical protein